MNRLDPANYIWWLASRASGVVALMLVTASVVIGLTMASKLVRKRGVAPVLARVHEHTALAGLVAIGIHGATLVADPWLHPSVSGVLVPFSMGYRPLFTGLGTLAGYLAAILGLSFYARRRIGAKLWRKLHRATVVVWAARRDPHARRRHGRRLALAAYVHACHGRADRRAVRRADAAPPQAAARFRRAGAA